MDCFKIDIKKIDINDDELLLEKISELAKKLIIKKEHLDKLSIEQKCAIFPLIYISCAFGDSHKQFFELYSDYISISELKDAMHSIKVDSTYIDIISLVEQAEFENESNQLFSIMDIELYNLGNTKIILNITNYLRNNLCIFFNVL